MKCAIDIVKYDEQTGETIKNCGSCQETCCTECKNEDCMDGCFKFEQLGYTCNGCIYCIA